MPLGWIDYSKNDRDKVLSVLDLLSESGTLDELGIAPVRDGFANLFFPGTSTIQTRAKYFMIVPYALKDQELSSETNPNRMAQVFDQIEKKCGEILLACKEDTDGVIGSRSLANHSWVKRTPADIYWAGLRSYQIFTGGTLSLSEYLRAICALKSQKKELSDLGNRNDNTEKDEHDDKDAGDLFRMQFWNIPTYRNDWMEDINIRLTYEEGMFLKGQILKSFPESMLAYILRNNMTEVFACSSFKDMQSLIKGFPEQIQRDYALAYSFSEFLLLLRAVYNMAVSNDQNHEADELWKQYEMGQKEIAEADLESIFSRLNIHRNVFLCRFLKKSQELMKNSDLDGLKTEIKRRERELKQSRARTLHPGEYDPDTWFGGQELDYRFGNAKVIMKDIFESEGTYVKSE